MSQSAGENGGLALDIIDYAHPEKNAETWEKVIRKIKTGMMPPSGARRPDRATLDAFATEIENAWTVPRSSIQILAPLRFIA